MSFFDEITDHIKAVRDSSTEDQWAYVGKKIGDAVAFPFESGEKLLDTGSTTVLRGAAESGMGRSALTYANELALKYKDFAFLEQGMLKDAKKNPAIALAVTALTLFPYTLKLVHHISQWAEQQSVDEASKRAHSHGNLESASSQQTKADLNLPYKKHSQIDLEKLMTLSDELEATYPHLFKPLKANIRLFFEVKTDFLTALTEHKSKPVQLIARTLLYSEFLERKVNFARPFSLSFTTARAFRAFSGTPEPSLVEAALGKLEGKELMYVKSAGLALGLIEGYFSFTAALHGVQHMFGKYAPGPYEDTVQKRQDAVRRSQYNSWRKGKKLAPKVKADDDGDESFGDQLRDGTMDFLNPQGAVSKALDIAVHPGDHLGTLAGVSAFAGLFAMQLSGRKEVWQKKENLFQSLKATAASDEFSRFLSEQNPHNIRVWGAQGAAGVFTLATGKNWQDKLGGFSALLSSLVADQLATAITGHLYTKPFFQESAALGLDKVSGHVRKFFDLKPGEDLPIPLIGTKLKEVEEISESLHKVIAVRKAGGEIGADLAKDLAKYEGKVKFFGQETIGPLLELVLFPLATQALKAVGTYLDNTGSKNAARKQVKHQERQAQKERDISHEEEAADAPGTRPAPKSEAAQAKASIHTHIHHEDHPIDKRLLNSASERNKRRGGNVNVQYSNTYN